MKKLLVSAILGGFVFSTAMAAKDICELDFVKDELKSSVSNEMVELRNAKCENNKIIYDFVYTPMYSADLENISVKEKAQAQETMENMLNAMYCQMPEFEPYRQNGAVLRYEYSTTNINKFYEIEISNKDCKN